MCITVIHINLHNYPEWLKISSILIPGFSANSSHKENIKMHIEDNTKLVVHLLVEPQIYTYIKNVIGFENIHEMFEQMVEEKMIIDEMIQVEDELDG